MNGFSLGKVNGFFVEYFANSSLLASTFASNPLILPNRKFHSDLFRGSLNVSVIPVYDEIYRKRNDNSGYINSR